MEYNDVKVSTSIPASWADALDRLAKTPIELNRAPSKAGMLRAGLRLYLQHRLPHEWEDLDLGPPPPLVQPPEPVIRSNGRRGCARGR
jgi:hypothetical protein